MSMVTWNYLNNGNEEINCVLRVKVLLRKCSLSTLWMLAECSLNLLRVCSECTLSVLEHGSLFGFCMSYMHCMKFSKIALCCIDSALVFSLVFPVVLSLRVSSECALVCSECTLIVVEHGSLYMFAKGFSALFCPYISSHVLATSTALSV